MIIDTNAYVSRWPFRRTPRDELDRLLEEYRRYGVAEAWVSSFDGLFHRDIGGVNQRLSETCQAVKTFRLVPFGSVNPKLPDWQEDLRRCAEQYKMPGIRLHPNYHGYRVEEPVFRELVDLAHRYRLVVQLVMRMEDPRIQDERFSVSDVDLKPLVKLVRDRPDWNLMVLNGFSPATEGDLLRLVETGRVWVDIATVEGLGGVEQWVRRSRADRMVFGSHSPLFSLESALLKMEESELADSVRQAILRENARRFLSASRQAASVPGSNS